MHLPGCEAQQIAVAVAVHPDGVTGRDDLRGQARAAPHLLAHQEEGRADALAGQDLEHCGCALGVGTVVERERDRTAFPRDGH